MISKHPVLYARSSTGAILVWWMEQEGEKFRSVAGQVDGKMTESKWTVAKAKNTGKKNERTPEQQAFSEIQNKYKKQLKSGGYWGHVSEIDQQKFFEPMLAEHFEDHKHKIDWSKGVGVQIKYNGGRILAKKTGLFSRKGERYVSIPHIEEALEPFFNRFPDAVLDGEGFNYGLRENLKELMKLLRKTVHITPEDFARAKELVRFYIYDGYGFGAQASDCYLKRKAAIDHAFFDGKFSWRYKNTIRHVPTTVVYSEADLNKLYNSFLEKRQEGAIIRLLGEPYFHKRTDVLLKYKPQEDAEFRVVRVNEGEGNWTGMAATVTLEKLDKTPFADGETNFDATVKGTEAEKLELWANRHLIISKVVTIYYFGTTGFGKPNYAQFDVNNYDKGH
jgi:DNA ligase-1